MAMQKLLVENIKSFERNKRQEDKTLLPQYELNRERFG